MSKKWEEMSNKERALMTWREINKRQEERKLRNREIEEYTVNHIEKCYKRCGKW